MGFVSCIIKGFPFFGFISLISKMNGYGSLKDIAEFFSFMRCIRTGGTSGLKGKINRFHGIFLGIGNDPFDLVFIFGVNLDKIVLFSEYDLFIRSLIEKLPDAGSKALQDVHTGGDRGGC